MMEARETVRVQVSVSSIRVTTPVPPCGLLPGLTPERTLLHTPSPPAMALCVPRMPPTSLCVSFRPPPCSGMRATPGPWTSSCQWVQSTSRLSCTTRPTATCAGSWARTGACSSPKPQQSQGRLSARCALVLLGLQAVQQQYPSSSNLVSTQTCECLAFVMVTCMHRVTSFSNGASQALAVNSPNMPSRAVPCHATLPCCAVLCAASAQVGVTCNFNDVHNSRVEVRPDRAYLKQQLKAVEARVLAIQEKKRKLDQRMSLLTTGLKVWDA